MNHPFPDIAGGDGERGRGRDQRQELVGQHELQWSTRRSRALRWRLPGVLECIRPSYPSLALLLSLAVCPMMNTCSLEMCPTDSMRAGSPRVTCRGVIASVAASHMGWGLGVGALSWIDGTGRIRPGGSTAGLSGVHWA